MKIFIYISHKLFFSSLIILLGLPPSYGQQTQGKDTTDVKMNMDAIYDRPFLQAERFPVAVGGYIETNTNYFVTDGITEGLSFHIPRMTIFISSTIKQKIKFLSEIEFEEGTKEINIEFAAVDFEFHPMLNLRGGIIMNPIGAFNQNHDGPNWEFVDRPLSATTIIPATFSNVGFGIHGKTYKNNLVWAYEFYLTNGFDESIITNELGRTSIPAVKENPNRFEESFNGIPLITAKTSLRHRNIGELGLSWMGGFYNKFKEEALVIDDKRRADVFAIDFNTTVKEKAYITTEWVLALIQVPDTYSQQFGEKQFGGFADIVYPIIQREMLGWENSTLNGALRLEYVDYNGNTFKETGDPIRDEIWVIAPAITFRPSQQTVLRLNYRYHWNVDILGNPPIKTAGIQLGISSYF